MQNVYAIEYLAYCEGSIYLLNDYVNDYLYVFIRKRSKKSWSVRGDSLEKKMS